MTLGEALGPIRALAVLIAFAAAWLLGVCGAAGGRAGGPANVLLVANGDFPGSVRLAHHYAKKRGIPASNLVTLALPEGEEIDREAYVRLMRDPLRKRISQTEGPIRCIVSFSWGGGRRERQRIFSI